jgi:flagellar motor component MotA
VEVNKTRRKLDFGLGLAFALMAIGGALAGVNVVFINWTQLLIVAGAALMIPGAFLLYAKSFLSLRELSREKKAEKD